MREISYHKRAVKYLQRMPVDGKERIKAAIARVALLEDPLSDPNVKPMAGEWESCQRLRVGGYRAIYRLINHDAPPTLQVLQVGPRGDVYKS
jgi:mRNA-degrading endonuclease RelE of RelBE toxin-antitoxin system